ncbi:hypothetical protein FB45DRAFT_897239 [Roridomyces roridus]|uniref:Uncharacterized protein n=1 Tax=Roridomyces roridus TaxID=1738132 RepID=A0AAD7CB64_9AGAR|nr:hypothetical protein FB45DRAFT_897239 [Roridomyces roridus]
MSEAIPDAEDGVPSPESTDPSSLRALALSTLKRRKLPAVDTAGISSLPQRPPTTDPSLQLDYGQDDIGSSPTDVEMPPPSLKPSLPDLGDGLTREEGEISDSEEASSKAAAKRALAMAQAVVKVESPPHNLLDRTSDIATVSLGECIVDPDHVRPGLSLNQGQYDTAKDIVLDLLGWGVPPDYLVDCNLSREIVYYVFSELNLRLPHNFDIAGLIPYTPAHVAMHSRPLSATPPAPAQPANPTPTRLHPSLPPKPLTGLNDIIAPRPSGPSSPPSHPSSPPPSTNDKSSLHDIEQQRRQELLARKAVQASRKTKPLSDASSTASSHAPADLLGVQEQDVDVDADVEMTPAIPTEAVDDFLKTIGEKSLTPEASIQPESNDNMDVDEIPGFSSAVASIPDQLVISPAGSPSSATPNHSLAQSDALRTSGETDTTTTTLELDQPSSDEQLSQHQALQRKGSKRPTAADFDDFDAGSRNGHRHHHGSGSMPNALRRKAASFASVSGHRKLVIDLSDSEGENGEDYVMQDPAEWDGGSGYSSPAPGRLPAAPGGGRATPPVMTPAALMEKEKEIRKMRELIAEREKNRKQKVVTRSSTFRQENEEVNGSSTPHPSNGSLQEDDLAPVDKHVLPDAVPAESASTSSSTTPTPIGSLFSRLQPASIPLIL